MKAVQLVLRGLIVANWLYGAAIAILLVAMPTRPWIMSALGLLPSPEADRVVFGLRAIAMIGLATIPINYFILERMRVIVDTVRAGNAVTALNAHRLEAIGWALVALQMLGLIVGAIVRVISTPSHPLDIDAGFSIEGWFAILLTFVFARALAGNKPGHTMQGSES
jgi:hypothetical protein